MVWRCWTCFFRKLGNEEKNLEKKTWKYAVASWKSSPASWGPCKIPMDSVGSKEVIKVIPLWAEDRETSQGRLFSPSSSGFLVGLWPIIQPVSCTNLAHGHGDDSMWIYETTENHIYIYYIYIVSAHHQHIISTSSAVDSWWVSLIQFADLRQRDPSLISDEIAWAYLSDSVEPVSWSQAVYQFHVGWVNRVRTFPSFRFPSSLVAYLSRWSFRKNMLVSWDQTLKPTNQPRLWVT